MMDSDRNNIFKKIDLLSKTSDIIKKDDVSIQVKLSIITILQYLKEIRKHFNSSSAGFLLEIFLGSLIHADVLNDYSQYDLSHNHLSYEDMDPTIFRSKGHKRITYQVKLYKDENTVKVNLGPEGTECDFYIIALKEITNNVMIYIFDNNGNSEDYIGNFAVIEKASGGVIRTKDNRNGVKRYISLNTKTNRFKQFKNKKRLLIEGVEGMISECGKEIHDSIQSLFKYISDLHYSAESIITGYSKNQNRDISIDEAKESADRAIKRIQKKLNDVSKSMGEQ